MILYSIELTDFRSFRGKSNVIEIARPPLGIITVFHGEMGHGKTTILNAFRWVLHGGKGVSNRFEDPNAIINKNVSINPNAEASVKLNFSHNVPGEGEVVVAVTRKINVSEQNLATPARPASGRLEITITYKNQSSQPIQKLLNVEAQNYINCIIPEGILDILFFDGEGIDLLATRNQNPKMEEAVRTILGFGVIERAISDLKNKEVLGYFEDKRNESVAADLKALYEKNTSLKLMLSVLEENHKDYLKEKTSLEIRKVDLDKSLKTLSAARIHLERRDSYERELGFERKRQEKALASLKSFIRKNAHTLVSKRLIQHGLQLERELRDKGKFPPPVMSSYVNELLERGLCMCERPLKNPSPERSCVEKMLHVSRDRAFHDSAAGVGKTLSIFNSRFADDRIELKRLREECLIIEANCRKIESDIDTETNKIAGLDIEGIKKLEADRDQCITSIARIDTEIRDLVNIKIPAKNLEIDENLREIKKHESQSKVNEEIKARVSVINDAIKKLNQMLDSRAQKLETLLQEKVNLHFQNLIDIESQARVRRVKGANNQSDSFHVDILKKNTSGGFDIEFGVNTGKRKCLAFAFIKSLVEVASQKNLFQDELDDFIQPEEYPIVMDAPFGAIDDLASRKISTFLPTFATQLVCLVNTINYRQVASALDSEKNTGRRYVIYHHYATGESRESPTIKILGVDVAVASVANDNLGERAEIKEIK